MLTSSGCNTVVVAQEAASFIVSICQLHSSLNHQKPLAVGVTLSCLCGSHVFFKPVERLPSTAP